MSLLTNLISYWKLDEASGTRNDSHGTNHLTDNNTVGSATGIINSGADFEDSSSEWLSHASNSDLSCGDVDWSFSLWVKLESFSSYPIILSKRSASLDYIVYLENATAKLHLEVGSSGFGNCTVSGMSTGTWYHIVASHDSVANQILLVVNNGTPATYSYSGGGATNSADFEIGKSTHDGLYFDGIIDEVAFRKGSCFSPSEITDLYNSGAGLAYGSFGGTNYTLAASNGSFTLTGQTTALKVGRKLTAAQASFTLTGQSANTLKGFKLTAAQASFTLSGQAASFPVTRKLTAAQATFTLSGQAAALQKGFTLSAAQASFTLTGQAASLKAGLKLTAAQASFTLTGQSAGLYKGKTLTAVVGTFALTGQSATLKTARLLTASQTTFTLTGQSSSLLKGRTLTAGQASFTFTGQSTALSRTYNLACQYGTLTLSGQAATLTYSAAEPEEDEEYTINYLSPQDNSGYTLQSISPQDSSGFVELERGPTPG